MKIRFVVVGRTVEKYLVDACAEYEKRLQAFCRLETCRLPEEGGLEKEAARIMEAIPQGAYTVAMCIEGKTHSSEQLAALAGEGIGHLGIERLLGLRQLVRERARQGGDPRLHRLGARQSGTIKTMTLNLQYDATRTRTQTQAIRLQGLKGIRTQGGQGSQHRSRQFRRSDLQRRRVPAKLQ